MSEIKTTVSVADNNGATDNKQIAPAGGDVFIQINRGIDCVITDYRICLCSRNAAGGLQIDRDIGSGSLPSPTQPGGVPAFYRVDSPAALPGRYLVIAAQGIALPPGEVSQIDFIVGLFQQQATGYRRVEWDTDSAHDKQLKSRFEITIQ
jgi:hypothetical protein